MTEVAVPASETTTDSGDAAGPVGGTGVPPLEYPPERCTSLSAVRDSISDVRPESAVWPIVTRNRALILGTDGRGTQSNQPLIASSTRTEPRDSEGVRGLAKQRPIRARPSAGPSDGDVESLLLDQLGAAVIALDLDGNITHWNSHAEVLYGWPADEVLGRHAGSIGLVSPDKAVAESIMERLRAGQTCDGDLELLRRDGTPFRAFVRNAPLRDPDGRVIGLVGVSVDVSEHEGTEAALRRRNAELLRAGRIARLDSWEWDLGTDLIRFTGAGDESPLWPADLPNGSFEDLLARRVHPDDRERVRRTVREAIAAGRGFALDFKGLTPEGAVRHVSCMAEMETDSAGKPARLWGTSQDVTEQREAERALRESEQARRRLLVQLVTAQDNERRRLAADIHDYAIQVLHSAVLRVEPLTEVLTDPEQADAARGVEQALRSAVVNLRSIVAGVRLPSLDGVELTPALEAYLEEATSDWPVERRLDSRLEREPLPEVRAVLFRIVVEAVVNARRHSKARALTVTVGSHDGGVRVEVADDGLGFTPEPDGQIAAGHYGLATMKERAELAGGWLKVHSEPGAGTKIETWVPHPAAPGRSSSALGPRRTGADT
jgi:PAS domain S-box-containing protein